MSESIVEKNNETIFKVKDLHVDFNTSKGCAKVLNGFDLSINSGEMVALVGESGSGKTVAAWAMLGLPVAPGKITKGEVLWHGENLLTAQNKRLTQIRGKEIGLILADPKTHLHPLIKIGKQLQNTYMVHNKASNEEAYEAVLNIIGKMGLTDAKRIYNSFAFELSGGMAQRIMIAMALINSPEFIIADDSTNGLDVTIQRQILDLMSQLIHEKNTSALMITHDLGIVAQYCKTVSIMYAGEIIESGTVEDIFASPLHPYTECLIGSIRSAHSEMRKNPVPGTAPDPKDLPEGCYFCPRCTYKTEACEKARIPYFEAAPNHFVRCLKYVQE